jgi:hypothetical protein
LKNENNTSVFWDLALFVINILCLPHSNAGCERVFNICNAIKTKSRNKLITETINGTLLSKQCVKMSGSCVNFVVKQDMLNRTTTNQLYKKKASSTCTSAQSQSNVEEDDLFIFYLIFIFV